MDLFHDTAQISGFMVGCLSDVNSDTKPGLFFWLEENSRGIITATIIWQSDAEDWEGVFAQQLQTYVMFILWEWYFSLLCSCRFVEPLVVSFYLWQATAFARERERVIPSASQHAAHYSKFQHTILECNETHMSTQAPCLANSFKTMHTKPCFFRGKW